MSAIMFSYSLPSLSLQALLSALSRNLLKSWRRFPLNLLFLVPAAVGFADPVSTQGEVGGATSFLRSKTEIVLTNIFVGLPSILCWREV